MKKLQVPKKHGNMRNVTNIYLDGKIPSDWIWWVWTNERLGICGVVVKSPEFKQKDIGNRTIRRVIKKNRQKVGRYFTYKTGVFILPDTEVLKEKFDSLDAALARLDVIYS